MASRQGHRLCADLPQPHLAAPEAAERQATHTAYWTSPPAELEEVRQVVPSVLVRRPATAFLPYLVVAVLHLLVLATEAPAATVTKLLLMPVLAVAVLSGGVGGSRSGAPFLLLLAAIALSWLGDGASVLFPFWPELPVMLACFGLAHVAYIRLFWRHLARRPRPPAWSLVYLAWWVAMIAVLAPRLGSLAPAVIGYGVVLGSTALLATRCGPVVAAGGAFFLASDTILAFRLFTPELVPGWASLAVMLAYTLGQGLIAYGGVSAGVAALRGSHAIPRGPLRAR